MGEQQPASRGRLVGRYVVHDRIAAGGMATVHLGRLLGAAGFSRTVAIKRLHDAYARDPDFVAMLLDEARLAASIRHPNVVATLDVVAEQDELLVVMEYIEGDSVAHLHKLTLNAGARVPIPFAAAIVAQALHGLHAAHEARDKNGEPLGIVHRDVSPQNILVGIDGVSRVLDFGIAKAASRATTTEDGQIKGKTAYMAPEQLQHGSVDRRTDVFAAAVVLWELLCGRRLFFADSPAEMMARVLSGPIDHPQQHAPSLPAELAAITLRGLDRDPAGRFATAEEMALAIEESIAMPRSKEVGAWVATVAKATLEGRAQLVQTVEQSSHKMPSAQQTSDPGLARAIEEAERRRLSADMATDVGGRASARPPPPPPPPRVPGEESTELATVQSTIHPAIQRPHTSRAPLVLAVAGGASLVVALGVALALSRGAPVKPAADTPPPGLAETVPPAIATIAPAASSSVLTVAPTPPAPVTVKTVKPPTPRGTPPPKKPSCEIPYVIDDKGQKHFKPECVN
jgi:serine/threonine-protein kinase